MYPTLDQQGVKTGCRRFAARCAQVEEQFLLGDIEQKDARRVVVKTGDQAVDAAPRGFQRLKGRLMQDRPHLVANGGVHRGDPGRLAWIGMDDVRLHDGLQQALDRGHARLGGSGGGRSGGRAAQQALEQSGVVFRWRRRFRMGRFRWG